MKVNYAEAIYDDKEINAVTRVLKNGWLGLGESDKLFCKKFSEYVGKRHTLLANSGSSANLIAISALKSRKLIFKLKEGNEIITPTCGFPTTINPIIQNGFIPKLVDINLNTYNIDIEKLKEAVSHETRALFLPNTLGIPNEMDAISDIVNDFELYFIEDNCDALGSTYNGQKTGSFGDISTCSFYPAHHITMGEGGSVSTHLHELYKVMKSIRDWGRDCWCDQSSKDGACGKRFDYEIDGVKYDHRYIYSHIGYNLKPTEMQAAFGLAQLDRLEGFVQKRKENYNYLHSRLKGYDEFAFPVPLKGSDPSWFCFPIRVTSNAKFTRNDIVKYLEGKGIQTRLLFAGNITKQPAYKNVRMDIESTENAETVMNSVFFIGVHPNLTKIQLDYMVKTIGEYI